MLPAMNDELFTYTEDEVRELVLKLHPRITAYIRGILGGGEIQGPGRRHIPRCPVHIPRPQDQDSGKQGAGISLPHGKEQMPQHGHTPQHRKLVDKHRQHYGFGLGDSRLT